LNFGSMQTRRTNGNALMALPKSKNNQKN